VARCSRRQPRHNAPFIMTGRRAGPGLQGRHTWLWSEDAGQAGGYGDPDAVRAGSRGTHSWGQRLQQGGCIVAAPVRHFVYEQCRGAQHLARRQAAVDIPADTPQHQRAGPARKLRPQSLARLRQAFRYGSQSPCRKPGEPACIRPSARSVFNALESATVNLSGRQAARTTLLMAGQNGGCGRPSPGRCHRRCRPARDGSAQPRRRILPAAAG
jgi:hypothetical protein